MTIPTENLHGMAIQKSDRHQFHIMIDFTAGGRFIDNMYRPKNLSKKQLLAWIETYKNKQNHRSGNYWICRDKLLEMLNVFNYCNEHKIKSAMIENINYLVWVRKVHGQGFTSGAIQQLDNFFIENYNITGA